MGRLPGSGKERPKAGTGLRVIPNDRTTASPVFVMAGLSTAIPPRIVRGKPVPGPVILGSRARGDEPGHDETGHCFGIKYELSVALFVTVKYGDILSETTSYLM